MRKCNVCGKETNLPSCCSACGGVSFVYCAECLTARREPYNALLGMGLYSTEINEDFKQQILFPSLKFYGKTVEQFDKDITELNESFDRWVKAN